MAVSVRGAATNLETLQNAVSATGDGSTLEVITHSIAAFAVTGTFTATVTFEGTVDGTNYVSIEAVNYATGAKSTTTTATGQFYANCAGLQKIRATVTWTSGTSVTVKARGLPIPIGAMTADIDASSAVITTSDKPAVDSAGTGAPTNAVTTANAATLAVKASAGTLYGLSGYNAKGASQFILLIDKASAVANGDQAVVVISAGSANNFSYDPGIYGRRFASGIQVANSSTQPTLTGGSADCHIDAQYA